MVLLVHFVHFVKRSFRTLDLIGADWWPVPWCKMFRRQHILEHDIQFDETVASNDVMFVVKATCWAKDDAVAIHKDVLYTVTTRSNSLMDNWGRDPDNFLCRLEVQIRYNRFAKDYGAYLRVEPIVIHLAKALELGGMTFLRALGLTLRKKALFSGFGIFLKLINKHTLKL